MTSGDDLARPVYQNYGPGLDDGSTFYGTFDYMPQGPYVENFSPLTLEDFDSQNI